MPLRYNPEFRFNDGIHNYELLGPSLAHVQEDLIAAFHRDVEGKLRQSLIDLGWTPPAADFRKPEATS